MYLTKKLSSLCSIKTGKKDVNQGNPNGKYPFFTCARECTYSDEFSFDTEAVLIAGNGDVGHVQYYNGKFEAYQRTYILSDFNADVSVQYLFRYLAGFLKDTVSNQKLGNTMPYIKLGMIADFEIPLPPLSEQLRIVSILDEALTKLDQAKENIEKNLQNAKEVFESYLQSVFVNPWEDWKEKTLQDIVHDRCTLSYGIVQPGDEFPNWLPVVRPTDLTNNRYISKNGLKLIDPKLADAYKRTTLRGEELLLCVRGTTGVVSIAWKELNWANVTRGIVPICFKEEILKSQFGYYCIISNFVQKQIQEKTYGTALKQINTGDLRKIRILIPSISEQLSIVSQLDTLSTETKRLESIYQQKLAHLDELRKSLLKKAFNGEL